MQSNYDLLTDPVPLSSFIGMTEAKRRRIDTLVAGDSRSSHSASADHRRFLAASSRVTELTAEQLEAELFALHNGLPEHRTLAWSCKNLIAFASPVPDPISTSTSQQEQQKSSTGDYKGGDADTVAANNGQGKNHAPNRPALVALREAAAAPKAEQQHERDQRAEEDAEQQQAEARSRAFQALLPPPAQSLTLQFVYLPDSQRSGSKRRPSLTAHKLFPSFSLLPPTSALSSPRLISFSPSGRTLIAYFPASPLAKKLAAATRAGELAAGSQAHNSGQAGSTNATAAPNAPTASVTGFTPALVQTGGAGSSLQSQSIPPLGGNHVATSLAPSAGKGRLCIWTQGASMALNDWVLRQIFFVDDDDLEDIYATEEGADQGQRSGKPTVVSAGAPSAPPGFVQLDGLQEHVPVPIPATPISGADAVLEAAAPGMHAIPILRGGIKEIRWCNQGKNLFIHPDAAPVPAKPDSNEEAAPGTNEAKIKQPDPVRTSYIRDAARGPTFTVAEADPKTATQGSTPATDSDEEACFLFGVTGIVSVIHRRPSPAKSAALGFPTPTTFSLTSTSLFESSIVALGTQGGTETPAPEQITNPNTAARTSRRITHLAVGGVPDEPLLLVACRIGGKQQGSRASQQVRRSPNSLHDQDGSGHTTVSNPDSKNAESQGNLDPLGLVTTITGCVSGAIGLGSDSIESGLGLGLGLEVPLGFEAARSSDDDEAIEDVSTVSEGMILLFELRLRTHGHLPSVVVRPLNPLPLPSVTALANPVVVPGDGILTHIQWLEYPSLAQSAGGTTSPLQLLLVSSHAGASPAIALGPEQADSMNVDDETKAAHHGSLQKYVFQRQLDPLSAAFGSLECKKAELPHAKPDWTFVDAGLVTFENRSLLSLVAAQDILQHGCLTSTVKGPHNQTSWAWLDPASLQLTDLDDTHKPLAHPSRRVRTGWAYSPNKVWAARTVGTGGERKVQLVTLPPGPKLAALDETTRKGLLLGRALRLAQSYDDIPLSFSKDSSALYDIVQTALVRAGIHNNNVPKKDNNQNHRLQQLERVVEIHLLPRSDRTDRMRLFLELLLCLRLLRFNDLGSRIPHLPFRFDSIWPLLAQLSWVLQILNRMSRTAVYLEAESLASSETDAAADKDSVKGPQYANHDPLLELLVLPAPRAIFVYIVQSLYRLAFWLLGDEAGPIPTNLSESTDANSGTKGASKSSAFGVRNPAYTQTVSDAVITWRKHQVSDGEIAPTLENFQGPGLHSTIAQQYEMAADACRALLDASAIRLDRALKVLQQQGDNPAKTSQSRWLEELLAGDLSDDPSYRTLAAGWLHKTDGADADLVPMFLSPEDLLDDVHALDRVSVTAAATSQAQVAAQNQRKTRKISHVGSQGKSGIGRDEHDVGLLSTDIVRKTCLQLRVLGFNQATAFGQPPPSSQAVPTVIKLCVRCGARTGTIHLPPVLSKGLSVFESAFRERCLCGGSWWFLSA